MEVDIEQLKKKATLTVSEAQAITGMSPTTIRRFVRDPKVTAFQCLQLGRQGAGLRGKKLRILSKPLFLALEGSKQ